MHTIVLAVLPVFILLIFTESLWRSNKLRGESARKFIHILVGSYVAFWPFYISFETIQLISALFLIVVGISLKFKIFKSIHGVARKTWGEVLFAVCIGLLAVLTDNPWVFMACILHMSVADGFAALAGKRWGKGNRYHIGRHEKSVIGTTIFWLCSLSITGLAVTNIEYLQAHTLMMIALLPIATSFTENFGVGGTDNILVPILVFLALSN